MSLKEVLPQIKGLKFPDPYIVKFFFKENLSDGKGKSVLELGCGNGNNLYLFKSYGYKTVGIDIDETNIKNANYNFKLMFNNDNDYLFIKDDIRNIENTLKSLIKENFNILLMPSIVYYVRKKDFHNILEKLKAFLSLNGKFYIRFRSPRDMRVGMGELIGDNEYIIRTSITDEPNAILSVYEEYEIVELLKNYLNISNFKIFHLNEENYHTDRKVLNSDIVIWGDYHL